MKCVVVGLLLVIGMTGCKKELLKRQVPPGWDSEITIPLPVNPVFPGKKKFPQWPAEGYCIMSYQDLFRYLKIDKLEVQEVILGKSEASPNTEGVRIRPGQNGIISISYSYFNQPEDFSLFRSTLLVLYDTNGYTQSYYQNCWSVGCLYATAGQPPFTNLVKDNIAYTINTSLNWSVAPYAVQGPPIQYLILK